METTEDRQIGARIRSLRESQRMSLTELARRAGISKSLLSQVELGGSNASVPVLRAIARELGVPFFLLFVETDPDNSLVRRSERRQLHVPGSPIERELLTPDLQRKMVMVIARLHPGEVSSPETPASHRGEECVLVLSGRIEIEINGRSIVLDEGDSFYFDSIVPHSMRNLHDGISEVLAVIATLV